MIVPGSPYPVACHTYSWCVNMTPNHTVHCSLEAACEKTEGCSLLNIHDGDCVACSDETRCGYVYDGRRCVIDTTVHVKHYRSDRHYLSGVRMNEAKERSALQENIDKLKAEVEAAETKHAKGHWLDYITEDGFRVRAILVHDEQSFERMMRELFQGRVPLYMENDNGWLVEYHGASYEISRYDPAYFVLKPDMNGFLRSVGVFEKHYKPLADLTNHLSVLKLAPGDVLLMEVPGTITADAAKSYRDTITALLKESPDTAPLVGRFAVLLHNEGFKFKVVKMTEVEEVET